MCYQCCPPMLPMHWCVVSHGMFVDEGRYTFQQYLLFHCSMVYQRCDRVTWCNPVFLGIPLRNVRSTWSLLIMDGYAAYPMFLSFFIQIYSYLLICLTYCSRLSVYCRYRTKCQIHFHQIFLHLFCITRFRGQKTPSVHTTSEHGNKDMFGGLCSSSLCSMSSEMWILIRIRWNPVSRCFRIGFPQQRRGILWEFRCQWFSSCTCNA